MTLNGGEERESSGFPKNRESRAINQGIDYRGPFFHYLLSRRPPWDNRTALAV